METVFMWIAVGSFVLALVFSGAWLSGDRMRANYHDEERVIDFSEARLGDVRPVFYIRR